MWREREKERERKRERKRGGGGRGEREKENKREAEAEREQCSNFDSWVVGVDRSGGMKYFCRKVTTQLPPICSAETNYPKI
jgi:hypothetical protein